MMMTFSQDRRAARAALALGLTVLVASGGPVGCGPKTEQATGVGMMAVGTAIATVEPVTGLAIAAGGAAVSVHGAYRDESGSASK